MARVTPMPGILSISGKVGNIIFKTRKKTDGTVDVRAYSNIGHASRTTPPSQKELNNRNLFAQVNREVGERIKNGDKRNRHVIFHEVYAELKNNTLPSR